MKTLFANDRNANDLLNATCYLVIEEHRAKCGKNPTGFHFNKYLSILQRETETKGNPLRLPHCWYRWGDEVALQQMPSFVRWDYLEPPAATVRWDGSAPPVPEGDSMMEQLQDRIGELAEQYAAPAADYVDSTKLRSMIDFVYSYAPFPFQNEYRQLREAFVDLRGATIPIDQINKAILLPSLERALRVFPEADFPAFRNQVAPFRRIMESLIDAGGPGIELARDASEAFWFAFCYHLRLHPSARSNIAPGLLRQWEGALPERMDNYGAAMNSILVEAGNKLPSLRKDPAVGEMATEAERIRTEDLAYIESFDEEFDGLGKYMDTLRKARQK